MNVNCINRIIFMKRRWKSEDILGSLIYCKTCLVRSVCHIHVCIHRTKQLVHTHTYIWTNAHVLAHICIRQHTYIHTHSHIHTRTHTSMYTYPCTCSNTLMRTHIHTQSDTAQTKSRGHRPELSRHLGLLHPPNYPPDHTTPRMHYRVYRVYRGCWVSSLCAPYTPLCRSSSYGVAGTSGECYFLRLYHDTI